MPAEAVLVAVGAAQASATVLTEGVGSLASEGAATASAETLSATVADLTMEGASAGDVIEAGDISIAGTGAVVFAGSRMVADDVYRPAWLGALRKMKRRKKPIVWEKRREVALDDEEVLELVRAAVGQIERLESMGRGARA